MKKIFILLCVLCVVWFDGQLSEDYRSNFKILMQIVEVSREELIKINNFEEHKFIFILKYVPDFTGKQKHNLPVNGKCFYRFLPVKFLPVAFTSDEYNEFSFTEISTSILFGPASAVVKKVSNCAFTSMTVIVGGKKAKIREFPHMALIGFENGNSIRWDCGGTLISEQFVLSAAHYFDTRAYGPPKYVRLGEHDQSRSDDGNAIDLRIIDLIPHPKYREPIRYNDIGAIRPACLPQVSNVPAQTAIATGWLAVAWNGQQSNVLQKVVLDMFTQTECNSTYRYDVNRNLNKGIMEETQVCAVSYTQETDTCQGDSGGYTIIGVTSFGKACGTIGTPGVYTRVYAYLDWIEGIVWPTVKDARPVILGS